MAQWFYKDGKGEIFDECPIGWTDHPAKIAEKKAPAPKKKVVKKKAKK